MSGKANSNICTIRIISSNWPPQSIDEYIEMFIVYKLKVADAEAAGLHQTDAFTKEFNGYCAELSRPYLRDSIVEKRLIEEAYARMATSRKVSHIMLPLARLTMKKRQTG